MPHRSWIPLAAVTLLLPWAASAQLVRSGAGVNAGDIQASVDQFRADLGTLNANTPGSVGSGRREINWDGVPQGASSPNAFAGDFFNGTTPGRARGISFGTAGTGFEVSANSGEGPVEFSNTDPSYSGAFEAFSAQKLFTPVGSNILDVNFFVPGTTTAAAVRGFGAVFSDVDLANTTSVEYFDTANNSLGTFFAPNVIGNGTFSFLGTSFADAIVGRVRITAGNAALGAGVQDLNGNPTDLVVMDDFIYGEPIDARPIPEPGTLALLLTGAGLAARKRRRA